MSLFRQFTKRVPYWAYAFVIFVIIVNTTYLIFRYQVHTYGGDNGIFSNGHYVITYISPSSPVDKAGLQVGDTLLSINSVPVTEYFYLYNKYKAGEILIFEVSRNNEVLAIPVLLVSYMKGVKGFFLVMYGLILLLSISSLYILYKKPDDPAARIFFIYLQLFAMMQNARNLDFHDPFATFANIGFLSSGCIAVAALIHFHLLFPRPSSIYSMYKRLPFVFYLIGFIFAVFYAVTYILWIYYPSPDNLSTFYISDRYGVIWLTLAFAIAFGIAVYQFITIKNTLARNQTRIVIIGSLFGFVTPMTLGIFYNADFVNQLISEYPFIIDFSEGIGGLIMILFLLVAIFRYRIWGTEIFIRKALLYLSATFIITLTYLLLIYLVDRLTITETNLARFTILAISVIVFLVLRDSILHLIERLFHREAYDSATAVSDFEEKMAGIYQYDDLKRKIVQGLDEIFHFKSFVFNLKKNEQVYKPEFVLGIENQKFNNEFEISRELERMLGKAKVFSPDELSKKPAFLDISNGELIVPLLAGDQPYGFFLCGQKQSESVYSLQDIRVLTLLARRVVALFHTASLYQKDLDRQLMLERERARISQDMHDDIGAGLTKIAMISEAGGKGDREKGRPGDGETGGGEDGRNDGEDRIQQPLERGRELDGESRERLMKVATTAREMINRLNVIVWALNPRYDNLDSLVSYARRYFGEYLENFDISFKMEVPDIIPDLTITPDFRRNAFYAWQEAVHNSVKHGACSEIIIRMEIMLNKMEISITDNGKGFDQTKPGSGGNGLLNMKKRAEEMGGKFEIQSTPGKGTRVGFRIPVVVK
jgi:signal transduction histidine kinase